LKSPIIGTVVEINVEVGTIVSPGWVIVNLADLTRWQVETTDLSENDVVLLKPGMSARVTLAAFPGGEFEGMVRKINLVGEDSRGSVVYSVLLDFDPAGEPVRWGMSAFVDISLP
jgi:multidrug resistance efflux pump